MRDEKRRGAAGSR